MYLSKGNEWKRREWKGMEMNENEQNVSNLRLGVIRREWN